MFILARHDEPGRTDPLLRKGDLRLRRCRHGVMLYSVRDSHIGRSLDMYGEYCDQEARLYEQLLAPGQVAIDAGANIGAFTLALARAVGPTGRVYAFEPQRLLFQMLCANLACNALRNVEAWPAGLGKSLGFRIAPELRRDGQENFGDVALAEDGPGETVPVSTIDTLALEACHLVKVDVQGMERDVLLGGAETIARHRPILYVENDRRERSVALIELLFDMDYQLYWHLPQLYSPSNYRCEARDVFANVVNVNVLCLPREDERRVEGLRAVASADDWWQDDGA